MHGIVRPLLLLFSHSINTKPSHRSTDGVVSILSGEDLRVVGSTMLGCPICSLHFVDPLLLVGDAGGRVHVLTFTNE